MSQPLPPRTPPPAPPENRAGARTCPQCGAHFVCGAEAGDKSCWCAGFPAVDIDADLPGCLCPACLEYRLKARRT